MLGHLEGPIDVSFTDLPSSNELGTAAAPDRNLLGDQVPLAIEAVLGDMTVVATSKSLKLGSLETAVRQGRKNTLVP